MIAPVFDRLATLADPIRGRLLLAVEDQELAVNELRAVLQLPQSTVSRHLKLLGEEGWVTSRSSGTSNWYRMARAGLDASAQRLWQVVREEVAATPAARRDSARAKAVLAERHTKSQRFFATSAGQWDRVREELFGHSVDGMALGGLLGPTWTVGDLGTGTGTLAATLAPLVGRVIAVDESVAMLAAARARLQGHANVQLRQGTLEALPIDSAALDLAMITLVLHYLAEPAKAVREAARTLTAGARVIVVDMMPHEHAEYRDAMGHQWLGFEEETVLGWFAEAGLVHPSYRRLPPQPHAKGPLLFVATAAKP